MASDARTRLVLLRTESEGRCRVERRKRAGPSIGGRYGAVQDRPRKRRNRRCEPICGVVCPTQDLAGRGR